MHDRLAEEQLRGILRAEGDGLSLTITIDELERRLEARRRAAKGRRVPFIAAAVAMVAVGTIVASSSGWISLPAVGAIGKSPSPAPTHLSSPAALPVASPSGESTERPPLGSPEEAILVRLVGDQGHPDAFEVTRVDPVTGRSTLVASIPWSAVAHNVNISNIGQPSISVTGRLAIPFDGAGNTGGWLPLLAIVDTTAPTAEPWIVDGSGTHAWSSSDRLGVSLGAEMAIDDPLTRVQSFVTSVDRDLLTGVGDHGGIVWSTDPETMTIARKGALIKPDWGSIGPDGTFTSSLDLPPAYQRTGLERPTGIAAHTVSQPCTSFTSPVSADCSLVETDANGTFVSKRLDQQETGSLGDYVWAADGSGLWLLRGLPGGTSATLSYARADGGRSDIAQVALPTSDSMPMILGITSEIEPGSAVVAIGSAGRVWAFVGPGGSVTNMDGTAWFAGWAGDQPDYDPD